MERYMPYQTTQILKPSILPIFFSLVLTTFGTVTFAGQDEEKIMQGFPPETLVDANNWRSPPFNRWSFQHMEMISPTATISRGDQAFQELKQASRKDQQAYQNLKMANNLSVEDYISKNFVDGVLVLEKGKIVAEHYANNQDKDTRHIMFSVGKSFTGIMAETLVHNGILDDTALVSSYVPELANSGYGDATVRQVMDMLVDVKFNEDYEDPYSDINQFIYAAGLGTPPKNVEAYASLYEFLPSIEKEGRHGLEWEYVSATTETLGWIMNRVTSKSWVQLFQETIYQHLQPRRDASIIVDAKGKEVAAGGMSMTLRDVGRFAYLVSNNGKFGGKQIIPEQVIKTIKAGGDPEKFPTRMPGFKTSYKSQWYKDITNGILGGYGIHGQAIQIGLDNDIIIITQSSWQTSGTDEQWGRRTAFQQAVFDALSQ